MEVSAELVQPSIPMTLVVFLGRPGDSILEKWLHEARRAAGRDLIQAALDSGQIDDVVVATADPEWADELGSLPVQVDLDPPDEDFHFGRRLSVLIEKYRLHRLAYFGAGSAPLLDALRLRKLIAQFPAAGATVLSNNLHSCDWALLNDAPSAVPYLKTVERDNSLAWVLAREAGFAPLSPPRSAATMFDIDTPTDLSILAALDQTAPLVARGLAHSLQSMALEPARVLRIAEHLSTPGASAVLAGRVSPFAWQAVNTDCEVWTRVFSEERGMTASGRASRGDVRSVLGDWLDAVGPAPFWSVMAGPDTAVLYDTRVLMASRGWPDVDTRFGVDLLLQEGIRDPYWAEFAWAARQAAGPVLLGGHSVVSGGLLAILEQLVRHTDGRGQTDASPKQQKTA